MLEVLVQDYIRTARAKGLREGTVIGVHALRNSLLPVVTLMGLQIGRLFADFEGMEKARVLVNSAGIFEGGKLADVTFENAGRMLGTNLVAPVMVSARFAEALGDVEAGAGPVGSIVNIADIGGIRPWANYTMYCASKAGLIAATKSMAKELAPAISVNAIAPGVITWPTEAEKEEYDRQERVLLERLGAIRETKAQQSRAA